MFKLIRLERGCRLPTIRLFKMKQQQLRFDGRVVIVTGAGAGLGRAYALLFGSRGASVVVNDLGGSRDGDGKSTKAADSVVAEIRARGGKAVPDYNSVVDGEKLVQTALENFGRIDVVVNNAGILRDKSFARISDQDWDLVHNVHLKGAFKVTQAAWPHMKKQNYGRIIMTSSNSGLYGNFGQANYSAAKMGLVGLANTLAIEGRKNNIYTNVIVPTAASRLTEDILPPDFFAELRPELIAPVVVWLCHESCEDNGAIIESAAGWATKCHLVRGAGTPLRVRITDNVAPEDVQNQWNKVTDMSRAQRHESIEEVSSTLLGILEDMKSGGTSSSSSGEVESVFEFRSKDSIIYNIGIGANVQNPSELKFLYENHEDFAVLPSYAIIPGQMAFFESDLVQNAVPGKSVDLSQILHGEQYIELLKPFPTSGVLTSTARVSDVMDKGKGAVILCDAETYDESGEKIAVSQMSVFAVGAGGFGGKRTSDKAISTIDPPSRSPDASISEKTNPNQAAIYRLSGDFNPLHIDPSFAAISGYSTPILHGLCSLGYAVRHVLAQYADYDPARCKSIKTRFAKPVYPGQTLKTDMWRDGNRIFFRTSVVENNSIVLTGGFMDLTEVTAASKVVLKAASADESLPSDAVFTGMQERIDSDKEVCKKINAVFVYNITKDKNVVATWTCDLKQGKVYKGLPVGGAKADTTLTVDDEDMIDIALGKLNPQTAFMKGKLKIKGNIMLAQKLKALQTAAPKL
nr:PREDICTED: peroxisomal multifunctional enzyme type 2 isoform X1 [Bemisia tabaci]